MLRELSPIENMTSEEYLATFASEWAKDINAKIRAEKLNGKRPVPSTKLIDRSSLLSNDIRLLILDKVAVLVDENLFGRSEMCLQFAALLQLALSHVALSSRAILGTAIYYSNGKEIFRWAHAWVRAGNEVIDGNVDSLFENPIVPKTVSIKPFWGPVSLIPSDRRLREDHGKLLQPDNDVSMIWWPDLRAWLDMNGIK